ncbi:translesion error-prone DNA polymerase V autoproteolytic subunit [Thiohalocapsa marina]|uniref:Translesion error-prone DNA polymerase V autoproteolytic subunit n=2 Tax=Thiohalocapsa marina TaxID=424902 RepID=A0A5M8F9A8_9GAMM|nr:translesion error-prone DNA polymerase V autoproteolytic subunit [Thiohalocapsa marina]
MRWPVQAGFPSPAEDDQEPAIDLNALLVPHPEATFLLRVRGHSMTGAGIDDGDVLLVDKALTPSHGRIVIAVVDGEFTVKRLHLSGDGVRLEAANPDYAPIRFQDGQELQVWGVVTRVIKTL